MKQNSHWSQLIRTGLLGLGMAALPLFVAVNPSLAQSQTEADQPGVTTGTTETYTEDDGFDWGWLGLLGLLGLAGLAGRGSERRRDDVPRYTDPADTDVTNRPGSRY